MTSTVQSSEFTPNVIADAVIDVAQSWRGSTPEEVACSYGIDCEEFLDVLEHVDTSKGDQVQAMAIGVLVGLYLGGL
jgi:hypothetical protein